MMERRKDNPMVLLSRVVTVMISCLLISGCGFTRIIDSTTMPPLQTGSPLRGISPKTFAFKELKDVRGTDQFLAGHVSVTKYILDQPASTVVIKAIMREFERNGHKCIIYSPQDKPDFIIDGSVYKYEFRAYFATFPGDKDRHIAIIAVKLIVSRAASDDLFSKKYEGEYLCGRDKYLSPTEMMSQAQMAMLKEISTDKELIEFLKK
jgi:hypothetical protein